MSSLVVPGICNGVVGGSPVAVIRRLGLSIARSVVTAHRATVTARSQPVGGLDISVVIPRPQDLAAESPP